MDKHRDPIGDVKRDLAWIFIGFGIYCGFAGVLCVKDIFQGKKLTHPFSGKDIVLRTDMRFGRRMLFYAYMVLLSMLVVPCGLFIGSPVFISFALLVCSVLTMLRGWWAASIACLAIGLAGMFMVCGDILHGWRFRRTGQHNADVADSAKPEE